MKYIYEELITEKVQGKELNMCLAISTICSTTLFTCYLSIPVSWKENVQNPDSSDFEKSCVFTRQSISYP